MNRRQFLSATGISVSIAGCLGMGDSVEDSDGDGVIDSEDYAPNDPSVQAKSDLQQTTETIYEFDPETVQEVDTTTDTTTTESEVEIVETMPEEGLPNPEIQRLVSSEPKLVSVDQTSRSGADEFTATIQNEGDNGQVQVTLYWGKELDEDKIPTPADEKSVFFDSGERRTVSLHADPPSDVEEYEMRVRTATRGAEILNRGAGGNVKVELMGGEMAGSEIIHDSTTIFIGEDSTELVTFDGQFLIEDSWEIEVSPASE